MEFGWQQRKLVETNLDNRAEWTGKLYQQNQLPTCPHHWVKVTSSPPLDEGHLFPTTGCEGHLFPTTGWGSPLPHHLAKVTSSPPLGEGHLFPTTGWRSPLPHHWMKVTSSPSLGEGPSSLPFGEGHLLATECCVFCSLTSTFCWCYFVDDGSNNQL